MRPVCRSTGTMGYYRRAYAWNDADEYQFIHHEVSESGAIGAANVRACQTGIAILNGARGGASIPATERRGVYNHLAKHLRDAGIEPPDLREDGSPTLETRSSPAEFRIDGEGDERKLIGHAAVFDSVSVPLFGFREEVAPGAFKRAIKEQQDVRALWNHDSNLVLGRTKANTLQLREDDEGLAVEISPPQAQWANDMMESVRRGDVDQMSFQFNVIKDEWRTEEGEMRRRLIDVDLRDVSPVTFPAYTETGIQLRSLGLDDQQIGAILVRIQHGVELTEQQQATLRHYVDVLAGYANPPPAADAEAEAQQRADLYRQMIEVGDRFMGEAI